MKCEILRTLVKLKVTTTMPTVMACIPSSLPQNIQKKSTDSIDGDIQAAYT